jgi:hypothetical protein
MKRQNFVFVACSTSNASSPVMSTSSTSISSSSSSNNRSSSSRRQEAFARAAAIAKARLAAVQSGGACSALLFNEDVQKIVFSFVGSNLWLVMGAVCQQWHFQYLLQFKQVWRQQRLDSKDTRVKHYFPTSYSAAFASEPLLELALDDAGLDLSCSTAQFNAGRYGPKDVLLLLAHEYCVPLTSADIVRGALVAIDGPKLQWLVSDMKCTLPFDIDRFAARSGSVDMLRLLQQQGVLFTEYTAVAAIKAKHLHVLKYLYSCECITSYAASAAAVAQRELSVLTFLYSIGHRTLPRDTVWAAARFGDRPLLDWSLQHGGELDEQCMVLAALNEQSTMCQYLSENGCPWTAAVTDAALQSSKLSVVQWATAAGIAHLSAQQQQQLLRLEDLMQQQLQPANQPEVFAQEVTWDADDVYPEGDFEQEAVALMW